VAPANLFEADEHAAGIGDAAAQISMSVRMLTGRRHEAQIALVALGSTRALSAIGCELKNQPPMPHGGTSSMPYEVHRKGLLELGHQAPFPANGARSRCAVSDVGTFKIWMILSVAHHLRSTGIYFFFILINSRPTPKICTESWVAQHHANVDEEGI